MEHFEQVRAEAKALSRTLDGAALKLGKKEAAFDEIESLWKSDFEPRARGLETVMIEYVPTGDPRIQVVFQSGRIRTLKSYDLAIIETPLLEATASMHLSTVAKQLRDLTTYLPPRDSEF